MRTLNKELNPIDLIAISGDHPVTTSLKVSEVFGKQHHHVMQKIQQISCSDDFLTRNFSRVEFEHRGNQYDAYEITKDGFMFLVMGFTGKKAASLKEAYINAFNWMAEKLANRCLPEPIISAEQASRLRGLVNSIAMQSPEEKRPGHFSQLYARLRNTFGVKKYTLIPAANYGDAERLLLGLVDQHAALPSPDPSASPVAVIDIDLPELRPGAFEVTPAYLLNPDGCAIGHLLRQLHQAAASGQPLRINSVGVPQQEWLATISLLRQQDQQLSTLRAIADTRPVVTIGPVFV